MNKSFYEMKIPICNVKRYEEKKLEDFLQKLNLNKNKF